MTFSGGSTAVQSSCAMHDDDPNDFTCGHGIAFIDGFLYLTRWNDVRGTNGRSADVAGSRAETRSGR